MEVILAPGADDGISMFLTQICGSCMLDNVIKNSSGKLISFRNFKINPTVGFQSKHI